METTKIVYINTQINFRVKSILERVIALHFFFFFFFFFFSIFESVEPIFLDYWHNMSAILMIVGLYCISRVERKTMVTQTYF